MAKSNKMWTVLVAVDPDANTSLLQWVQEEGRDFVTEVLEAAHASQIPNVLTLRADQPIALWLSTVCPQLPEWAQVITTLVQHRTAPTRIVLLAEGTPDGVAGDLGSLAATPLVAMATIFRPTQQTGTNELVYNYAAIGEALWSAQAPVVTASGPAGTGAQTLRVLPAQSPTESSEWHEPATPDGASGTAPASQSRWFRKKAKTPKSASSPPRGNEVLSSPVVMRTVLPPSRLIVVVGGKGGVGKTTVVASLIRQAARRYGSAMGIDFDYLKPNLALHFWPIDARMPNIDELFDSIDIARGAAGDAGIDEETERRMVAEWIGQLRPPDPGILVVPGPTRRLRVTLPPERAPGYVLDWALAQNDPVIVVDTDPALDEAAETALNRAGQDGVIVLVTTPEYDALAEADRVRQQMVQGLGIPDERIVLLLNYRGSPHAAVPVKEILTTHLPGLELVGTLPWVPKAANAALMHQREIPWPRRVHWDRVLTTLTGRQPDTRAQKRARKRA
ncbi:hypothetical protein [Sulfobacillus thermosulfidooxidans]|uniref:nucleotide-binding protein n=1 Tax=Sulfobacillus thermosulfidooxidans TaxID=28034 RepID=UPI0006B4C37A|nr:hypothetical protein [Sulfobacillus thermosulfidooxidans]